MEIEGTTGVDALAVPVSADTQIVQVERDVRREVGDVIDVSRNLAVAIRDPESRAQAVNLGADLLTRIRNLESRRNDVVPPLRTAYERVRDLFDEPLKRLKACKTTLSQAVSTYDVETERKQRLEREAREAEARRQREEYERKQREWEAEQARIKAENDRREREAREAKEREEARIAADKKAAEDARLADEERLRQERAAQIEREEESRIAHAEEADRVGNGAAKVDHILEHATPIAPVEPPALPPTSPTPLPVAEVAPPVPVSAPAILVQPPPPPPPPPPAQEIATFGADGTIKKNVWKCDVVDLMEFVRGVADGRIPLMIEHGGKRVPILEPNLSYLSKQARALKDEFRCPGVRAWPERQTDFKAPRTDESA